MGLVERDGVIVLVGLAVTIAASIAAAFLLGVLIHYAPAAWSWGASLLGF
jgi:hypothetical protein